MAFIPQKGIIKASGSATLSSGSVVVATTFVKASSIILLSSKGGNVANIGIYYISSISAGVNFTISSSNQSDASTVNWVVIEPN